MPRIDDYKNAKEIAAAALAKEAFSDILDRSGYPAADDDSSFKIEFLGRTYRVRFPDFVFSDEDAAEKEVPLQEQVLVLHYLLAPRNQLPSGHWIAYREIPGASFYFSAFVKRAIEPLKSAFGHDVESLAGAARHLKGQAIESGDAGFSFLVMPHVPVQLIIYAGDEEFPPEAGILFDQSIGNILSPEDVAWLAGMLVYRLISLKGKG
jgi:hypothetical protein